MSDTPRTDAYRSITAPKAEDNWAAFARILERDLAAVTAERDALRRATKLGLRYAEFELQRLKSEYKGWSQRWELDEQNICEIKAALSGEGEP